MLLKHMCLYIHWCSLLVKFQECYTQDQINYALILFMFLKSSEVIIQNSFQIDYMNIFFDRVGVTLLLTHKYLRSFCVLLYIQG